MNAKELRQAHDAAAVNAKNSGKARKMRLKRDVSNLFPIESWRLGNF